MKSKQADSLLKSIDVIVKDLTYSKAVSPSIESYLAKFFVVYVSGIYEAAIEAIVNEMVSRLGNAHISQYIYSSVDHHFRNPSIKNIIQLLNQFNSKWGIAISSKTQKEKDSLDSINVNKNAIAHGSVVTITIQEAIDYYLNSVSIIREIDDILL